MAFVCRVGDASCLHNTLQVPLHFKQSGLRAKLGAVLQAPRQNMVDAVQRKDPNAVADKLDQGYKSELAVT